MGTEYLEEIQKSDTVRRRLAKKMAHDCFRNSKLEDFHADPDSRLNDAEMKELMIDVVNNCYDFITVLFCLWGANVVNRLKKEDPLSEWNEPVLGSYKKFLWIRRLL